MTTLVPVSVALKFGFLAVLYLFLLWVARSALRDLRRAQGSPAPGRDQVLGLALADVPVRVDMAAVLPLSTDHLGAGRGGQVRELGERILGGPAVLGPGVDGDEEGLLDGLGELDERVAGHRPKDTRSLGGLRPSSYRA